MLIIMVMTYWFQIIENHILYISYKWLVKTKSLIKGIVV
jgi:hypothetical protein